MARNLPLASRQPATVYKLVDRSELEHVRVANAIRISEAALAAYLKRR